MNTLLLQFAFCRCNCVSRRVVCGQALLQLIGRPFANVTRSISTARDIAVRAPNKIARSRGGGGWTAAVNKRVIEAHVESAPRLSVPGGGVLTHLLLQGGCVDEVLLLTCIMDYKADSKRLVAELSDTVKRFAASEITPDEAWYDDDCFDCCSDSFLFKACAASLDGTPSGAFGHARRQSRCRTCGISPEGQRVPRESSVAIPGQESATWG